MSTALNPSVDRPVKTGKASQDTEGNPVLVNPQGKAFAVNTILKGVWDKLDGARTVEQVVDELVDSEKNREGYKRDDLEEIIRRLHQANLAS
mgnify:CR=1 FL=1